MNKRIWLVLALVVFLVVGLVASGCSQSPPMDMKKTMAESMKDPAVQSQMIDAMMKTPEGRKAMVEMMKSPEMIKAMGEIMKTKEMTQAMEPIMKDMHKNWDHSAMGMEKKQ